MGSRDTGGGNTDVERDRLLSLRYIDSVMGGDVGARDEDAEGREDEEGVTRDDAVRVDSTELERDFFGRLDSSLSGVTRFRFLDVAAEDVEGFGGALGSLAFDTGWRSCGGVAALG